jgi:hypothetical protein
MNKAMMNCNTLNSTPLRQCRAAPEINKQDVPAPHDHTYILMFTLEKKSTDRPVVLSHDTNCTL